MNTYKEETDAMFLTFEELLKKDYVGYVSFKIDGELSLLVYEKGKMSLYSRAGRVRQEIPILEKLTREIADKVSYLIAVGELHVVDSKEKVVPYAHAISVLRKPTPETEKQIRLLLFDLIQVDKTKYYPETPYSERVKKLSELFSTGVVQLKTITKQQLEDMWNEVLTPGSGKEGLVLVVPEKGKERRIKVKPLLTVDLIIVGVEESKKHPGQFGSALLAFMNKEGLFVLDSKVGSGWSDAERKELWDWAQRNAVKKEGRIIWVDPFKEPKIVEVKAREVIVREGESYRFDKKTGQWIFEDSHITVSFRQPSVVRFRPDKKPTPSDLRLEQVPQLAKQSFHKKVIVFDFDGVLVEDEPFPVIGKPKPHMIELVKYLKNCGYTVFIHSARGMFTGGLEQIRKFCEEHGLNVDGIFAKPLGDLYIDDRCCPSAILDVR